MPYSTLKDLPAPLEGKTGWPWTEECISLPEKMSNGQPWPKISIVTPSYNSEQFIEETIRSVLLQGYPALEYFIFDGGSHDNTKDVIKKYEKWLTGWESVADRGQSNAINKGLKKSAGQILAYINSDDYYLPVAFRDVAEAFIKCPETDLLHGKCWFVNEKGFKIGEQFVNISHVDEILDIWEVWSKKKYFVQPEVFFSRRAFERIGLLREDLNIVFDYEYWLRIINTGGIVLGIDKDLACFRFTANQKTAKKDESVNELLMLLRCLLWDKAIHLSYRKRLELQGKLLYQTIFLKQVEESITGKERKFLRWYKSFFVVLLHPKIMLDPHFKNRIVLWLKGIFR